MNYYEPFQRLDNYVYSKKENIIFIKSAISVLLPTKVSLISREPVFNGSLEATIEYYTTLDNSSTEPGIYTHERLIKFIDKLTPLSAGMSDTALADAIRDIILKQVSKNGDFKVNCIVYNEKKAVGGQVTNTISQQGEVIIL